MRKHVAQTGETRPLRGKPSPRDLHAPAQEIEAWVEALKFYDNNEFDEALKSFDRISDTSKILFNMGVINATLGQHEQAVRNHGHFWPLEH